ncbi:MAG: N-acetylglucosamine-6-phosphate deacetylase [Corallococcus sp.]|nr:N-acetylglucosamine-6-phosphate deacetylase [Corallococcus sp.]MCM1359011.1 N-acetylglucosamine-6-phosphate deacetylase [Corallococcus sp.]MCM1395000.1 N-acetylglucosamine-6-phosphate deacetylase [Corallococcus sp.]
MILYKNGLVLIKDKLERMDIVANRGKIIEIAPDVVADDQTEVVDCTGRYVLPALIDIHTHGANGYDFNTADLDGMKKILEFYVAHGVGTVLPTVMTDSDEHICRQLSLITELAKDYPEVKGIHLEGPFLSQKFCGAMPVEFLQTPSMDKFLQYQKAAKGMIKVITVAPELDGALDFIATVSKTGVVVSVGHSAADGATVQKAIDAGAKSFTHWGNAMAQLDRHDLNVSGTAMLCGNYCEVICDGKHVQRDVFRLLVKTKGADKVVCITDSIMATGLPDGEYSLAGYGVEVVDGDARLKGSGVRAGSTLDAYTGLANAVTFSGLPLYEAIKMWTINPAKLIGLSDRVGTIEIGKDADFILFG